NIGGKQSRYPGARLQCGKLRRIGQVEFAFCITIKRKCGSRVSDQHIKINGIIAHFYVCSRYMNNRMVGYAIGILKFYLDIAVAYRLRKIAGGVVDVADIDKPVGSEGTRFLLGNYSNVSPGSSICIY